MCKELIATNININEIEIKEFRGQRVVTFKDIDAIHKRVEGTAKRNFSENKDKMIEEEDYFLVKPKDIKEYEIRTAEINNFGTYLITESGYLMIVKSFTDDLAWKVQRKLINGYFKAKENLPQLNIEALENRIALMIDSKVDDKIKQLESYYKPTHLNKIHISNYIKGRLGIQVVNNDYKMVVKRVCILLGANKWQDISFQILQESMDLVDECIEVFLKNSTQIDMFDEGVE